MSSSSFDGDVYTGVWVDWSYGRVQGTTLTLTRASGALLIAFLAMFVGATGRSFWKIARYLLHFAFATESKVDGVYHQRQAVLRNTQIATDAGTDLLFMRLAWRNRTRDADKKLTSIAGLAFLSAGCFVIAGIFSSRVTGGNGNNVLLSGSHCGNITAAFTGNTLAEAQAGTDYDNERTQLASQYLAYAYRCYPLNLSTEIPSECKTYVQPALPYTKNTNASCPFDSEMCVLPQGNLELDSGYLDSYDWLGLNDGPRFSFRLARQCAPLVTEGYTTINSTKTGNTTDSWVQYNYGTSYSSTDGNSWKGYLTRNFTWRLRPQPVPELLDWEDFKVGNDYVITSPYTSWYPITPLNKTGGAVSLLFMQSGDVKNVAKVTDPWFSATLPQPVPEWTNLQLPNNSYYVADDVAKVMACSTIVQFCNPNLPDGQNCWSRLATNGSWESIWPDIDEQYIMNAQSEYFTNMFQGTIETPEGYYTVNGLPALKTRFTLNGVVQPSVIPPTRWQDEMEYIFQADLAAAQARVVELGSGDQSGDREFLTACGSFNGVNCTRLCLSQKVKSPGYYSFSMLGICIIIIFGTCIVALAYGMEPIVDLLARLPYFANNRRFTYARLEWQCNSTFELQRLAQESMGLGTWSHGAFSVPVTEQGEALAGLDITDEKNPRLRNHRNMSPQYDAPPIPAAYAHVSGVNGYGGYNHGIVHKAPSHSVINQMDENGYERVPFKE